LRGLSSGCGAFGGDGGLGRGDRRAFFRRWFFGRFGCGFGSGPTSGRRSFCGGLLFRSRLAPGLGRSRVSLRRLPRRRSFLRRPPTARRRTGRLRRSFRFHRRFPFVPFSPGVSRRLSSLRPGVGSPSPCRPGASLPKPGGRGVLSGERALWPLSVVPCVSLWSLSFVVGRFDRVVLSCRSYRCRILYQPTRPTALIRAKGTTVAAAALQPIRVKTSRGCGQACRYRYGKAITRRRFFVKNSTFGGAGLTPD